jgi:hypothetical protein
MYAFPLTLFANSVIKFSRISLNEMRLGEETNCSPI